jgi:hypothetical protein
MPNPHAARAKLRNLTSSPVPRKCGIKKKSKLRKNLEQQRACRKRRGRFEGFPPCEFRLMYHSGNMILETPAFGPAAAVLDVTNITERGNSGELP